MSNPFYQQQNYFNPQMSNIYQMLTHSNNPIRLFKQLAMNNPTLQPILNMLNQGISPQQLFNNICQQKGINPQEFIKNLTGR